MNNEKTKSITGDIKFPLYEHDMDFDGNFTMFDQSGKIIVLIEEEKYIPFVLTACNEYPTLKIENEKLKALNSELVECLDSIINGYFIHDGYHIYVTEEDVSKAKELINKHKTV